jgi:hypothetical protein
LATKTTRVFRHQRQQRIDIGAVIGIGRHHRQRRSGARQCHRPKAIADVDDLVPRPGIGLRGDMQQFVAGAHHDARGDAVQRAQRRAQILAVGIGIERRGGGMGARLQRRMAGAQRVLIGRQLDQRLAIGALALAGDIGVDRADP